VALNVTVNADSYSVRNPKITVNYTDPVFLVSKSLIPLEGPNIASLPSELPLCQLPKQTGGSYVKGFTLYTRDESSQDSGCNGAITYLVPGTYELTLEAVDPQGKQTVPNAIDVKDFIITGMDIWLAYPASGVESHHPYNVSILTSNLSRCRYAFTQTDYNSMSGTDDGGQLNYTHRIRNLEYRGDLYVICEEASGRDTPAHFVLGWDTTSPRITATATPARVIDPRYQFTNVEVHTDDNTTCWFDGQNFTRDDPIHPYEDPSNYALYSTTHAKIQYYTDITDKLEHNITHTITCRNLAGLENTTKLNVTVNYGLFTFIDVINPPELYNQQSFTLKVAPTFPADGCTVNGNDMMPDESASDVFNADFSVAEGKNTFDINCTGSGKTARRIYNVTIDTTPPDAPTLEASDKVCSGRVSAKFNASDATGILSYTYIVSDARGKIEEKTVLAPQALVTASRTIIPPLSWEVFATDMVGNSGSAATATVTDMLDGDDEECGLPQFIFIKEPNMGFAWSSPYRLVLGTIRPSECRFALQQSVGWSAMTPLAPSADNLTHTKNSVGFPDTTIYVLCNESDGTMHRKTLRVGLDSTAPVIGVLAKPNPVIDPLDKVVMVTVTTNDRAFCTHNSTDGPQFTTLASTTQDAYTTDHTTTFDYRSITSAVKQQRDVRVSCTNLALLSNSTQFSIIIDLGATLTIEVLAPKTYTADEEVTLSIRPSKSATCIWHQSGNETESPFTIISGDIQNETLGALPEGSYSYIIDCTAVDGQATTVAQFIVDRTSPGIIDLSGPDTLCPATEAVYHYNVTGLDKNPVIAYSLERSDGGGVSFQDNTSDSVITLSVTGVPPGDYTLKLVPINNAGLSGAPATKDVAVKGLSDEACVQPSDHCTNKQLDPGEEGIDCGGTCPNTCIECTTDANCPAGATCTSGVCVNAASCASDDNCGVGERCTDGSCIPITCTSNAPCFPGTICVADACVTPPLCTTDSDCSTGASCKNGICVLPTCGNGIMDGSETGIDCGGSCPACITCTAAANTTNYSVDCVVPQGCEASVCVSPPSCSSDAGCDAGHVCQASDCIPVATCELDAECPEGKTCKGEVCNIPITGCTADYQCSLGETCVSGVCTPSASGCTMNSDCANGEECVYGVCTSPVDPCQNGILDSGEDFVDCGGSCDQCRQCDVDNDCDPGKVCDPKDKVCVTEKTTPTPPVEKKSHLLSLLLIIIGIAIMGGAGYFLYEQDEEKRRIAAQQAAAAAQAGQRGRTTGGAPMDPQVLARMRQEQAARQAAMREELAKRTAEKSAQRSALFSGFDSLADSAAPKTGAPTTSTQPGAQPSVPSSPAKTKPSPEQGKEETDGFVDLSVLGKKKGAKDTKDTDDKKESKDDKSDKGSKDNKEPRKRKRQDDDAFDELSKL
jgi:hypothetical protein